MKSLDPMQVALIKNQFKLMLADIGMVESPYVLHEILQTGEILAEVLVDDQKKRHNENKGLDPA